MPARGGTSAANNGGRGEFTDAGDRRSERGLPTSSPSANLAGRLEVSSCPNGGAYTSVKRLLLGRPIPTHLAHHERLSRVTGLAVLSSDALSSVAYATEEILRVLVVGGLAALTFVDADRPPDRARCWRSSPSRTGRRSTRIPSGGGAYIVSKDNLGDDAGAGRRGGAAHRLHADGRGQHRGRRRGGDVRVSRRCTSTASSCRSLFLAVLAVGNLRGIRESGRIFAVPTYFFIVMMLLLLGAGAWRYADRHDRAGRAAERRCRSAARRSACSRC